MKAASTSVWNRAAPRIGLAYAPATLRIIESDDDCIDYVEVPFELLESSPAVIKRLGATPAILHSASMSLAGNMPVRLEQIKRIGFWADRIGSPWIGEHLAFITAKTDDVLGEDETIQIGFTVPPPMNMESVAAVCERVGQLQIGVGLPIALENSPLYFDVPGSSMTQVNYISEIIHQANAYLLLDITHLYITCVNFGLDLDATLDMLPLDRVIEIHLSGVEKVAGVAWDHHASPIPSAVLDLFRRSITLASPLAITLEYNWIGEFADDAIRREVDIVREIVAGRSPCQTAV